QPAASGLDSATLVQGIGGTTLCQREAPIRKTLRTKAKLTTAEVFPAAATRHTLWRNLTRIIQRRQTRSCRLTTKAPERKKALLIHFRPGGSCRLIAAMH